MRLICSCSLLSLVKTESCKKGIIPLQVKSLETEV